jgi:hypothetical protein
MNIAHKIFTDNPEIENAVRTDLLVNVAFDKMEEFVRQRLMPLRDEIDKQEGLMPDNMPCTLINVYSEDNNGKILLFNGYTKELSDKMKSCFSADDFKFIVHLIENIISSMDN